KAGWPGAASSSASALQLGQVVDILQLAELEDVHEDAEADHGFSRGDSQRHQREQLAVEVLQLPAEGDQRQVDRVQQQLDADQDHQRVAADQDADRADAEEQRGEAQE